MCIENQMVDVNKKQFKKDTIILKKNNVLVDVNSELSENDVVEELNPDSPEVLSVYRHSCAHLLAQAVLELFPEAKIGIGPATDSGFYYDFIVNKPFSPEDLQSITKKMKFFIKQNIKVERLEWKKKEAVEYFSSKNQDLKIELINEKVLDNSVSVYRQGEFVDMCKGPHLQKTGLLKHFKLMYSSASYWKGDENNAHMQRIYGIVFPNADGLNDRVKFLKEAKERDHRKLGKELDLYSVNNEVGAGIVLWHPKGSMIRHEIEKFWKDEHISNDYELLYSPHIARLDLWKTSGHVDFYAENMFSPIEFDNTEYQLKPMNCPFHLSVFKAKNRSYKEMPFRWAELGTVYRYERSGVLHGLMRVRGFTQDDAHIFCTPDQLESEVHELIDFTLYILKAFGFDNVDIFLSTRPEKYVGELDKWDLATNALEGALKKGDYKYEVDPGEGVFYGPKIDIKIKDMLGRSWQCSTIQIDFNLPERFNLKFVDKDGSIKQPIMIHRALLGSLERFFGILIENFGGFFPAWLSPVQVCVLPVTDDNIEYAKSFYKKLKKEGVRAEIDYRSEGIGRKIRDAEVSKTPYIVIVGKEEEQEQNISYRIHKQGDKGKIEIEKFINGIKMIIGEKKFTYEI